MKMIQTPSEVAATQYASYIHNCLRNPACEPSWGAPLPAVSTLQLFADFGDTAPGSFEFTLVNLCTGATEQITPAEYVVGQTPELGYYGVFKVFNNPAIPVTSFVVHLSAGSKSYFSEMLVVEPCTPLMKVKSCHPRAATVTGFDINGIYYGLPFAGASLGDDSVRYFHIAYVRRGKVKDMGAKATFKSSVYFNFRTTIEKIYQFEPGELVPKWYKDVLLAIYSRGAISFDDGPAFIVSDINFTGINDDDLQWKAFAQLKETFKLYYGCDDGICEECCSPSVISADAVGGGVVCCDPELIDATAETVDDSVSGSDSDSDSEPGGSESDPGGSESESGSEPEPEGLRFRFNEDGYAPASALSVENWNTLLDTDINADTPVTSIILSPGTLEVTLFGQTNLDLVANLFDSNFNILGVFDDGGTIKSVQDFCFGSTIGLIEFHSPSCEVFALNAFNSSGISIVDAPNVNLISDTAFQSCTNLVSVNFPGLLIFGGSVFWDCTALTTVIVQNCTSIGAFCFRGCTALATLDARSCVPFGTTTGDDSVFFFLVGNTTTITIASGQETDGDIVAYSASNTVTLILI